MSSVQNLNEEEIIVEEIINFDSDNESFEIKEFPQKIVPILFYLNNYNTNLISLIKRDYPSEIKNIKKYTNEYFCINSKWMNYFLEVYNYKKIKTLIKEFSINSGEELYSQIKEKLISLNLGYKDSNLGNIKSANFEPKKDIIYKNYFNVYKSGELARYFDDFVLVDKKLYDEIKQYDEIPIHPNYYKDEINENKVEIYLVDDIFIYVINENVLGIGIPEIPENIGIPIFKIDFFIIINKNYINEEKILNSVSEINEIFKSKDLVAYLIIKRKVRFENMVCLKKLDMIFFNDDKIGFIYNINDFTIEKYWRKKEERKFKIFYKDSKDRRKREEEKFKEKEKREKEEEI